MTKKSSVRFLVFILAFSFAILGCEGDESQLMRGKLEFSFNVKSPSSNSGRLKEEVPKFLLITIQDSHGNKVYDRKKIELYSFSGNYLSEPIDLRSGAYLLTEFLVVDDAGMVTHATPLEDSKLAYLVADPLPIEFTIVKDETTKVVPEAVEIDDFASAEDFGYTTFSFDIVETISFQIAVFTYDSIADNFELTTSSVEISGDSTTALFDQDIPDSTSRIVVRQGFAQYTVKVTKDGYTPFVKSFTAQELLLYKTDHILIVKLFESNEQEVVNRCIQFDGADDYINLGNIYDSLQLPFTVSAWVNIDQSVPYVFPIFVSQDNAPLYNGFWFCITKTNVFVEYGDGRGQNNPAFRKGKSAYVSSNLSGSWVYVTAVVRGAYDIDLYVNGVNVGGEWTGESAFPMASNYPYDVAKLGTIFQNDQTWSFKGLMDDVSVWNRSLSSAEVMDFMNHKFTGIESGLIGHWNFDEEGGDTILDKSPYHYNGIINGSAERVVSTVPGH